MKLGDILQSWRGDNAVRRGVQAADDWSNEQLQYLLGPQGYGALSGATALAREVTPAADFRDYVDYGGRAVESARGGDAAGALENAGWAGLATLGAVLPGSAAMVDDATDGARKGIRAYHGSPHDFDKFDMSNIGTGEGAQAYGHGLYFADAEGTAREYRDALSPGAGDGPRDTARRILDSFSGDRDAAVNEVTRRISAIESRAGEFDAESYARLMEAKRALLTDKSLSGHMYEVRINADPEDFLDWDKPLSEQPQKVREAILASNAHGDELLQQLLDTSPEGMMAQGMVPNAEGAAVWKTKVGDMARSTGGGSRAEQLAMQELRDAGIPGIKYLDGMSRNAGDGSRNYVVFDDSLIEILRKYGLAGLIAGGGAMTLGDIVAPQQEQ